MAVIALGLALAALAAGPTGALAESGPLKDGRAAFEAGKTEAAIKSLSAALIDKASTPADVARAYYYRGLAYRKAKKPAQAIADLNNALWLKGLGDSERAEATKVRSELYQAAGVTAGAVPASNAAAVVAAAAPQSTAAPVKQKPAAAEASPAIPAFETAVVAEKASEPVPAPKPVQRAKPAIAEPWTTAVVPANDAAKPVEGASSAGSETLQALSDFFTPGGSLFGGLASSTVEPTATTASTTRPSRRDDFVEEAPVPRATAGAAASTTTTATTTEVLPWQTASANAVSAPAPVSAAAPAEITGLGWQSDVSAASLPTATKPSASSSGEGFTSLLDQIFGGSTPAKTPAPAETASLAPAATTAGALGAKRGRYQLQVASLRSEREAAGFAKQLQAQRADVVGGLTATIDPIVIGNMGTFYQVKLGPFADEGSSQAACEKLRASGVDCFPVAN